MNSKRCANLKTRTATSQMLGTLGEMLIKGGDIMVRGLMAGGTDYSNQSLDDLVKDINNWQKNIEEVLNEFEEYVSNLERNNYWEMVDFDFKALHYSVERFFKSSLKDLKEINDGINSEIKNYHVKLALNMGKTADDYYRRYGDIWHSGQIQKDFGDSKFMILEKLYNEGRGMVADMIDLWNLSNRLEDFVGRDVKNSKEINTNNFYGDVKNLQQNYGDSNGIQYNLSDNKEELKSILNEIKNISKKFPEDKKVMLEENVDLLKETIENEEPKENRIKVISNNIINTLKTVISLQVVTDTVIDKTSIIVDNFQKIIESILG